MVDSSAETARLRLEPLALRHAEEMVVVLSSPALHRHIGSEPPTLDELERRFARLQAGSADLTVEWRNWVMRLKGDGRAVGWLQATLTGAPNRQAEVAWVVEEARQGRGLATEAARWLLGEVARLGATRAVASISPTNAASVAVARRLGMTSGALAADGEVMWSCALEALPAW